MSHVLEIYRLERFIAVRFRRTACFFLETTSGACIIKLIAVNAFSEVVSPLRVLQMVNTAFFYLLVYEIWDSRSLLREPIINRIQTTGGSRTMLGHRHLMAGDTEMAIRGTYNLSEDIYALSRRSGKSPCYLNTLPTLGTVPCSESACDVRYRKATRCLLIHKTPPSLTLMNS